MAILTQTKFLPSPKNQLHTSHTPILRTRVHCSATNTTTKVNPTPEKLVIKPPLQQLEPSPSPSPSPALLRDTHTTIRPPRPNDPSLLSTWSHRTWVASGCTTVLVSLAKSITCAADSHIWLEPILAGLVGYVLADLGSGVYHWGIDNYGDALTPIFGIQIEAFQGHHKWPWTITKRQFANNLHALARVVTFIVLPIDLVCDDPVVNGFVAMCSGSIMFSQQFHAWAHGTKSRLPPLVVALQDLGVLVSRSQHAAHHRQPYNNNYCIVSGIWNELLDQHKVFEALEMILYFNLGLRPRSWSEPTSEWTEEIETASQLPAQ
ncbi:hypothetical protein FF1_030573 [Malus domestica]